MAYCTKEQVADEFNGVTFGASTQPTSDTVDRWIAEADSVIDAKVGLRYVVPIVNAADLIIVRQISIMMVASRVRVRLNRQTPDADTTKVKPSFGLDQAMKMLDSIVKGTMDLPNSTLLSSGGGVSSYTQGLECPHTFKKNVDQW